MLATCVFLFFLFFGFQRFIATRGHASFANRIFRPLSRNAQSNYYTHTYTDIILCLCEYNTQFSYSFEVKRERDMCMRICVCLNGDILYNCLEFVEENKRRNTAATPFWGLDGALLTSGYIYFTLIFSLFWDHLPSLCQSLDFYVLNFYHHQLFISWGSFL